MNALLLIICLLIVLVAAAAAWILFSCLRRSRQPEEMLARLEIGRAQRLCVFVDPHVPAMDFRGNKLWEAFGGRPGVRDIRTEWVYLIYLSIIYAKTMREIQQEDWVEGFFLKCVYLRFQVSFCLIEDSLKRNMPTLPRMQAYALAKLYCDIIDTVETLESLRVELNPA